MKNDIERTACTPFSVEISCFNPHVELPFGLTTKHIHAAMTDYTDFLGFVNLQLNGKEIQRLETILMPANFSSMVGEFMVANIPKHCNSLVKNEYHNGHPDMIPTDMFEDNSVQHSDKGIEVKASRYLKGWQGHNPENTWLMVFMFDSNRPKDKSQGVPPRPFKFLQVAGAMLTEDDWSFAGRSSTSRRTITASVKASGYEKMMANWIYRAPELLKTQG